MTDSRAKGTRGEQAITRTYREQGFDTARVPNSGGLATKGDIIGVPGHHVEVKSAGRIAILDWLAQAAADAPPGQAPALHFRLCRRGRTTPWYVALELDDFIDLLKRAEAA